MVRYDVDAQGSELRPRLVRARFSTVSVAIASTREHCLLVRIFSFVPAPCLLGFGSAPGERVWLLKVSGASPDLSPHIPISERNGALCAVDDPLVPRLSREVEGHIRLDDLARDFQGSVWSAEQVEDEGVALLSADDPRGRYREI